MQKNLQSERAAEQTTEIQGDTKAAVKSAPIELNADQLKHVGGGLSPNGTWLKTDSPNGTW